MIFRKDKNKEMNNSVYKVEFSKEHALVEQRIANLEIELKECESKPEKYNLANPVGFIETQIQILKDYQNILELRAKVENIELMA